MIGLLLGKSPVARALLYAACGLVLLFLIAPLLVVVPLSFNAQPYFTFPIESFSDRWYRSLSDSPDWHRAAVNSLIVASLTTVLSTILGTLAALGLSRPGFPFRTAVQGLIALPMVVPMVVTGAGIYFLYARIGLTGSIAGLVLAHTTIAVPFVVVTVTAALSRFDFTLLRAAASLGASPLYAYRRVVAPLVLPGILSGMVFAFITSLDDVVIALFIAGAPQWTLSRQMWSGLRENIDPTILAAATCLTLLSVGSQLLVSQIRKAGDKR